MSSEDIKEIKEKFESIFGISVQIKEFDNIEYLMDLSKYCYDFAVDEALEKQREIVDFITNKLAPSESQNVSKINK